MLITVALTLMSEAILNFIMQDEPIFSRMKKSLFKIVRKSPIIGTMIKEKVDKTKADMANDGPWVLPKGMFLHSLVYFPKVRVTPFNRLLVRFLLFPVTLIQL